MKNGKQARPVFKKTAQFIMKPLHLALMHSCPKIITAYQVVKK